MRQIGILLFLILMVSACTASDDLLPTQLNLAAPTKTLIPTQSQSLTTPTLPDVNTLESSSESVSGQQVDVSDPSNSNIAQPTDPAPDCNLQDDWDEYTVQRGDNLANIASRTGSTIDELAAANCLENPNRLRAGQLLYVPNNPESIDQFDVATIPAPTTEESSTTDSPSVSVSIKKTFSSEKGFDFEYPADWNLLDIPSTVVTNTIITSFEYTLGDEIPQNRWTEDMVSITITVFQDPTTEPLSAWTTEVRNQFAGASNISQVNEPESFLTDSDISGQQITYISSDETLVSNVYFIINNHKVQVSIGGNIDLALPVIQSIRLTEP